MDRLYLQPAGGPGQGILGLSILDPNSNIIIHHPQNMTYNFNYSNLSAYPLDLNVSSTFGADNWSYDLYDVRHDILYTVEFTPNVIMNATRWANVLTVYGENIITGVNASANVTFYVNVTNHAPLLANFSSDLLVCEGGHFDNFIYNATDIDEDNLTLWMENPSAPFFSFASDTLEVITPGYIGMAGWTFAENDFFLGAPAGNFTKNHVGVHNRTLLASDNGDPQMGDTRDIGIGVIEINNPPRLQFSPPGSVFTVWAYGVENRTFASTLMVDDEECSVYGWCDYEFNLTFNDGVAPFFSITSFGYMFFTADANYLGANNGSVTYNLTACVTDRGLSSPHQNISLCGQDGSVQGTCLNFQLVVTAENRPPRIEDYYPDDLVFSVPGEQAIYFNASSYDPDGNNLDYYWYVDNVLRQYTNLTLFDEFTFSHPCGAGGLHPVKVEVTDGELNASVEWNVSVSATACLGENGGGGGGGGGGGATFYCIGIPVPCGGFFSEDSCDFQKGCSWDRVCSGTPDSCSCENLSSEDSCTSESGCSWDGNCTGTPDSCSCENLFSEDSCTSESGCSWDNVCSGTPDPCDSFVSGTACASQEGCYWSSSACEPIWNCNPWFECNNVSYALEIGELIGEEYRDAADACEVGGFPVEFCGYQSRECFDENQCGTDLERPPIEQACYYTEDPDCFDGIKNCHDGSCEFLVDCGGPCSACTTCSDGVHNQGEEDVDCGGPCPVSCPIEGPAGPVFLISVIIFAIAIAITIVVILLRYVFKWRVRKTALSAVKPKGL